MLIRHQHSGNDSRSLSCVARPWSLIIVCRSLPRQPRLIIITIGSLIRFPYLCLSG